MKILLVYPKPNISFDTTHCVQLGLAHVAAVLEEAGHTIRVLDLNVQEDTLEADTKWADAVGFYVMTPAFNSTKALASRVKEINPSMQIIVGGPFPSALPEECLKSPYIDIVIKGEGERTAEELFDALEKGKSLETIKGIYYKKENAIKQNPEREKIQNLDDLPFPAYHLFPFYKYNPTRPTWIDARHLIPATMMTQRGCPFECNFCFSQRTGFRAMTPARVVEHITRLRDDFGVNVVEFQDDVFNLLTKRSTEICELLIKEKTDINWSIPNGVSRVENVTQDFLQVAKDSGCVDVWFAGESGNDYIRNTVIKKRNTTQNVKDAVAAAKRVGFETGAFFVFGHPGETKEQMQETINFACSMPLDRAQFTIATPFPGTDLYKMIENAGEKGRFLETNWDYYGPYEAKVLFEYGGTKKETVEEMYKKAFRSFYLRPSYLQKKLVRKETYTNLPLLIKEAVRFVV